MLKLQMNRDESMRMMSAGLEALRRVFPGRETQMVAVPRGAWGEAPVLVTTHDFESLLRDSTHDGWLTGEAIASIMRTDAALAGALMINPNVWAAYLAGRQRDEDLSLDSLSSHITLAIIGPSLSSR